MIDYMIDFGSLPGWITLALLADQDAKLEAARKALA